jgi:hypothetical protein
VPATGIRPEAQALQRVEQVLHAARDQVVALTRRPADEEAEHDFPIHAELVIGAGHAQLIEIGEQLGLWRGGQSGRHGLHSPVGVLFPLLVP